MLIEYDIGYPNNTPLVRRVKPIKPSELNKINKHFFSCILISSFVCQKLNVNSFTFLCGIIEFW